jgi:hypothetical protein
LPLAAWCVVLAPSPPPPTPRHRACWHDTSGALCKRAVCPHLQLDEELLHLEHKRLALAGAAAPVDAAAGAAPGAAAGGDRHSIVAAMQLKEQAHQFEVRPFGWGSLLRAVKAAAPVERCGACRVGVPCQLANVVGVGCLLAPPPVQSLIRQKQGDRERKKQELEAEFASVFGEIRDKKQVRSCLCIRGVSSMQTGPCSGFKPSRLAPLVAVLRCGPLTLCPACVPARGAWD